jgi:hypothetical protein
MRPSSAWALSNAVRRAGACRDASEPVGNRGIASALVVATSLDRSEGHE